MPLFKDWCNGNIKAKETVTLQGSELETGGDLVVDAESLEVLTGQ